MKSILVCCCAILVLASGCGTTSVPPVVTHVDQYSKLRTDLIPENLLDQEGEVREMVWLNASRLFRDREDFDYYLEVHYEAREETGYLDIQAGDSLFIVADGKELKFASHGSYNTRRKSRGLVSEDAIYQTGPNELSAIARAQSVKVRIKGKNGLVQREFKPDNFDKFRQFVKHFVDNE